MNTPAQHGRALQVVLVDIVPEAEPEPEGEPEAEGEAEAEDPDAEAEPEAAPAGPTQTVRYDTLTADIEATVLAMYDAAVAAVQSIPSVELPYSNEAKFELRLQNEGVMPVFYLTAPTLAEPGVQVCRKNIIVPLEQWRTHELDAHRVNSECGLRAPDSLRNMDCSHGALSSH